MEEIWKSVVGFEKSHQVSNLGRIKSMKRNSDKFKTRFVEEKILKPFKTNCGYAIVDIRSNGKRYAKSVHRIVSEAFLPNLDSKKEVNHINGNKQDNSVVNLEWATRHENVRHAFETGLKKGKKGGFHNLAKLTEAQVLEIRKLSLQDVSCADLAKKYNLTPQSIHGIIKRVSWTHI